MDVGSTVVVTWEQAVMDAVGEIDHHAFWVHAERGGDQLGVHGVDQVDQAGAAQHPRRDAAGVSTWLTYAVDAGVRWALVPRVTITCGLSVARRSRWARLRCSTVQLAGSSGTGWGRCPSRIVQAAGSIWS